MPEMTDDEWADYESGPYCQHWADPWECDEVCIECGVWCCNHEHGVTKDHEFVTRADW